MGILALFDLDEHNDPSVTHDQVDLPPTNGIVLGNQDVTMRFEIAPSHRFSPVWQA